MAPNPFFDAELMRLKQGRYRPAAYRVLLSNLRSRAAETRLARPELTRELRSLRLVGLAGAGVTALALWRAGIGVALWLPCILLWLVLCSWVRAELGLVRDPGNGLPVDSIGLANVMTLFRGWAAAPMLAIGLGLPGPTPFWAGLGIAGGLTDLFDGSVARGMSQESRLGRLLDPFMDAVFFGASAVSLAHWGFLPVPIAAVILVRYFLPLFGGVGLMLVRGETLPVRHTPWGQRATMAVGLALFAHWLSAIGVVSRLVPLGLDGLALLTMLLAVAGIARRAPVGAGRAR